MTKEQIKNFAEFAMRNCHAEDEAKAIFTEGIADIAQYTGISLESDINKLIQKLPEISEIRTEVGAPEGAYTREPHNSDFFEGRERGGYIFSQSKDGLEIDIMTTVDSKNRDAYVEMHGRMALAEMLCNSDLISNEQLNYALQSNIAKGAIDPYKYRDTFDEYYIGYEETHAAFRKSHEVLHDRTFLGDTKFHADILDSGDQRNVGIQSVASCLMQNESFTRSYLLGEQCTIDLDKISQLCNQYEETKDLKYIIQAEKIIIEQTLEDTLQSGTIADYIRAIEKFDQERSFYDHSNKFRADIEFQTKNGDVVIPIAQSIIDEKIISDLYAQRPGVDIATELNPMTRSQDCKDFVLAIKGAAEAGIQKDNDFDEISYERNKKGILEVTCGDQKIKVAGRELFNGMLYVEEARDLSLASGFERMKEYISHNGLSDFISSAVKGELALTQSAPNEQLDSSACRQTRESVIPLDDIIDRGGHSIRLLIENPDSLSKYSDAMRATLIDDAIRNTDFAEHNSRGDNILHILANDDSELSKQIIDELKENHTKIYVKLLNEENDAGKIPFDYIQEAKDNDVSKTVAAESVLDSDTLKKLETEAVIDDGEDKIIGIYNGMVIEY